MCKPKIKDYVHLWMDITLGYSRENLNREGGLGYYFFKIPGNSTLFFLGYPWKFHFVFNYALSCRPVPTKIL